MNRLGKGGAPLERYVIHIFHRDPEDPKMIAGTVEGGWGEKRKGFLGYASLWRILNAPRQGARRRRHTAKEEQRLGIMSFTEIMRSVEDTEGERRGD